MPEPNRLTAHERSIRARIAALSRWSKEDPREATKPARAGFLRRFLEEVDPHNELPEAERNRRAEAARRAYFARLALKSAKTRRAKAARKSQGRQESEGEA